MPHAYDRHWQERIQHALSKKDTASEQPGGAHRVQGLTGLVISIVPEAVFPHNPLQL
jgi:hypothetical protein